ncbi:hypothetical protein ACW9KT_18650 [Hymenobacter sp. HD11105]
MVRVYRHRLRPDAGLGLGAGTPPHLHRGGGGALAAPPSGAFPLRRHDGEYRWFLSRA